MNKYTFNSNEEPTDEQLEGLMMAVLEDVKERAANADARFKALQAQQIKEILQKRQLKQRENGRK